MLRRRLAVVAAAAVVGVVGSDTGAAAAGGGAAGVGDGLGTAQPHPPAGGTASRGVERRALRAFVLTDVHVDNTYAAGTDPATNCQRGHGNASRFGSYQCDTPVVMLDAALAAMRRVEPAPDYVFWLGDQVPYISAGRSMDEVTEGNANLTAKIMGTFPQTRLLPVIGNHDTYPCDQQMAADPAGSAARFLPLWKQHLSAASRATFLRGGYYTELLRPGVRAVVINNALWMRDNQIERNATDPGGMLAWIDATLAAAARANETVWLLGHVPLGGPSAPDQPTRQPGPVLDFTWNQKFLEQLQRHASVIKLQIYGHLHDDTLRLVPAAGGAGGRRQPAVGVQFAAPSLTTWIDENPRFRLLEFDPTSGRLENYAQFFARIDECAAAGRISFAKEYDAASEYGLVDVGDPAEWERLVDGMAAGGGKWPAYWAHYHGRGAQLSCNSTCQRLQVCRMRAVALPAYYEQCELGPLVPPAV